MTLSQLLHSLSDDERDFIANLDYGLDRARHRAALDVAIEQHGEIDFGAQGFWYPYEVIELGKNSMHEGHQREYAACMGIVLLNIDAGRDRSNNVENILAQDYNTIQVLPHELRKMIDSQIERIISNPIQDFRGLGDTSLGVPEL